MTNATPSASIEGASPPMTPERWRAVDAILKAALACEPDQRDAVVANACSEDAALHTEVSSLLAAHRVADDDFLGRPVGATPGVPALSGRLASALADRYAIERESAGIQMAAPFSAALPPAVASSGDTPEQGKVGREAHITPPGRTVSGRTALYAAVAMLVLGVAGGVLIDRSFLVHQWLGDGFTLARAGGLAAVVAPREKVSDLSLTVVDRAGRELRRIPGVRPWTPRFSRDGRRVVYGAFGPGRQTSDLWVTDLDAGTTLRLTDDDADANDPQWSPDGATVAYSASTPGGKGLMLRQLAGGAGRVLASNGGTQFPSDWLRDGSALLVTTDAGPNNHDIIVQPADGSAARPYAATQADETAARISPDGRWVAYTSDASGRAEVYLDSYPRPGHRLMISSGGGAHPVWRGDGRELYYWRDGTLVALQLGAAVGGAPPTRHAETVLFRAPYPLSLNTMYDVSSDGERFVIVRQP